MRGYGPFFYFGEAFRGLRANSLVNLLAIGTISMAMLIVGFFLLVFLNLQSAVNAMGDRLELSVYLKDGLSEQDRDFIRTRIKAEPGVKSVAFLPRARALEVLKKELKDQQQLIEGLGDNPLPDSYEVVADRQYADSGRMEALAGKFSRYYGVEDVSYGRQGVEVLGKVLKAMKYGGMALAALLGVSVVFIISNSVRLALYSRGQEIELMQWIGATRWFIQGPFLIEGALVAASGTALAVGVLAAVYFNLPQEAVGFLSGPSGLEFMPTRGIVSLVGGGGALGLLGAFVSVNRFLE